MIREAIARSFRLWGIMFQICAVTNVFEKVGTRQSSYRLKQVDPDLVTSLFSENLGLQAGVFISFHGLINQILVDVISKGGKNAQGGLRCLR